MIIFTHNKFKTFIYFPKLKSTLEVLQGMIEKSPKTRTDVAIQTDFPAAMLEEYVVKNRRRILTLLGVHRTSSSRISTDREFEPLNQNSVPNQESGPRCVRRHFKKS